MTSPLSKLRTYNRPTNGLAWVREAERLLAEAYERPVDAATREDAPPRAKPDCSECKGTGNAIVGNELTSNVVPCHCVSAAAHWLPRADEPISLSIKDARELALKIGEERIADERESDGDALEMLVGELGSQDNLDTSDPIYMVQEKRRIYGIVEVYGADGSIFTLDGEEVELDGVEVKEENCEEVFFKDEWVNSQPFLTRKAASEFIERQMHNLKSPRIYVKSGCHNREWRWLREFLPSIQSERLRTAAEIERLRARVGELETANARITALMTEAETSSIVYDTEQRIKVLEGALRSIADNYDHEHHSLGSVAEGECDGPPWCRACEAQSALTVAATLSLPVSLPESGEETGEP